eukprot:SAG31_NODE_45209_length_259_cov_1.612500_1_plen_52_part_10
MRDPDAGVAAEPVRILYTTPKLIQRPRLHAWDRDLNMPSIDTSVHIKFPSL